MSAKEKGKFEDMAEADKEREMKTYIPSKGESWMQGSQCTQGPLSAFFFCSEYCPQIKGELPDLSIGDVAKKLGDMWNHTAADDKQPYEKKAAELNEKYKKDIAAYQAKVNTDAPKRELSRLKKSKKKKEEEEDEDNEEGEEEEDEEG